MKRLVCTIGPTLSHVEASSILPDAEIRPPVAHGDVLQWDLRSGDVLAIIDGLFYRAAAIRHKEILVLMSRGVRVVGASSMGALRAVELDRYGMEGAGRIYRLFRARVIDGDDEVAVLHCTAEDGYRPITEALVNVRYTCRAAVRRRLLQPNEARVLIRSAKGLPFTRRTWAAIVRAAIPNGLSESRERFLQQELAANVVDVKRQDASRLLKQLRDLPHSTSNGLPSKRLFLAVPETVYVHGWKLACPRGEASSPTLKQGSHHSDQDALTLAQVYAADYPEFQFRVNLERFIYLTRCDLRQLPTASHLERLASSPPARIHAFAPNEETVIAFLTERLSVLKLAGFSDYYTWRPLPLAALEAMAADAFLESGIVRPNTLEELPWRTWLRVEEISGLTLRQRIARLASRSLLLPPGVYDRTTLLRHLRLSPAYAHASRATEEVSAFNTLLRKRNDDHRPIRLSRAQIANWFWQRWMVRADPQIALFERGFLTRRDFLDRAAPFFPFDKLVGKFRGFRIGPVP